jgi:hypothetical protein
MPPHQKPFRGQTTLQKPSRVHYYLEVMPSFWRGEGYKQKDLYIPVKMELPWGIGTVGPS